MQHDTHSRLFESNRAKLLGLAYRILGSLADAEDVVQDTYLKWTQANDAEIENASSWLTTVCTRKCLDILKSSHHSRVNYIGTWLPEPIHTPVENSVLETLELASSLTTAFLLLLERLSPKERAAYLLHDIFEAPYPEVATTLNLQENTCRKLVSRARQHVDKAKVRHSTPVERQEQFVQAFKAAVINGNTNQLKGLLAVDVQLSADGGGKAPTIRETLVGENDVTAFLRKGLHKYWDQHVWQNVDINRGRGLLIKNGNTVSSAVTFSYDENGNVKHIFIVRNPEKIKHLDAKNIH